MIILVTGSAGFIGANFVLGWLVQWVERVIDLDKLTYACNLENLSSLDSGQRKIVAQGDIGDLALIERSQAELQPLVILNFSAEPLVDRSIHGLENFIETNIIGTIRLQEAARVYWRTLGHTAAQVFRVLHISTDEVYYSLDKGEVAFSEAHQYGSSRPCSASKIASNHSVGAFDHTYGLPVLITNYLNNYYPHHFPEKLTPLMIVNALAGKTFSVYSDGQQISEWEYVIDHCSAIRRVLAVSTAGEVYNVGRWNEKPTLEIVHRILPCWMNCVHAPTASSISSRSPASPTALTMTVATPSMRASSNANWAGRLLAQERLSFGSNGSTPITLNNWRRGWRRMATGDTAAAHPGGDCVPMIATRVAISEVILLQPKVFGDERGFIYESFNQQSFEAAIDRSVNFVQNNHSCSANGVLRGLHYQRQQPQGKRVRVVAGEVFDVVVGLRKSSAAYGQWVGELLNTESKRLMWVAEGFTHGFFVLSEDAEFLYKTIKYYVPGLERCTIWVDPQIGIQWPFYGHPALSTKGPLGNFLLDSDVY